MYIESVQLKNFRNYDSLELDLAQGTNIFYGNNARERPISWRHFIFAELQNRIKEAEIRI